MTRSIPWPRILAEGVAIVVSILLAFGIQAWWEDSQDRAEGMEAAELREPPAHGAEVATEGPVHQEGEGEERGPPGDEGPVARPDRHGDRERVLLQLEARSSAWTCAD